MIEPFFEEAPFEELCGEGMVVNAGPSFEHTDLTCIESLELTPISSPCFSMTPYHLHAYYESLCDIRRV